MNTVNLAAEPALSQSGSRREIPISVQILSTLVFGGFAITATVLAFAYFWPAGVVLAILLAWRGGFAPQSHDNAKGEAVLQTLCTLGPEAVQRTSGNASFDAYRDDVLTRLEDERENFESFLTRLRAAKDQSEFDRFMDARVQKISEARPDARPGARPGARPSGRPDAHLAEA